MPRLANLLVLTAYFSVSCGVLLYSKDISCDLMDQRIDSELSGTLARMPEIRSVSPQEFHPLFPGLEVGKIRVAGLNKLSQYGPAIHYCANGSHMLQVDFLNDGHTVLWVPWKACTGVKGRIMLRPTISRFTAQFGVVEYFDKVRLELKGPIVPVTTQGTRLVVEGFGNEVRFAFELLGALLPGLVSDVWCWQFSLEFDRAFSDAVEKLGAPGEVANQTYA